MARCILCPLATQLSGDEVLAAILGLGAYMFPRVFGDEFGDEFGDSLNLVINLVTNSVMNFVNH